jgi:hypothetical protein
VFCPVLLIMCGEAVDVPEPASLLIFMTGLFLLFFAYRYRNSLRPKAK